jgi:murein DD-endopeptidase MepM/ murein hydrolase activator NlpD
MEGDRLDLRGSRREPRSMSRQQVWTTARRGIAAAILLALTIGPFAGFATAKTPVRQVLLERRATVERTQQLRRQQAELERSLRERIGHLARFTRIPVGPGGHGENVRLPATLRAVARLLTIARARLNGLEPWMRHRLRSLHARYANLEGWLDREGIFRVCPVPGYTVIHDDFGDIVRLPHVPVHRHMGNDVEAPTGSPIVAPFDGYASTSHGKLGGIEIRVFGLAGYVYNAHASSVGQLGWVSAGDVVGYVGATGDATGPHDHLEWHPGDGPALDPNALLIAACVDTSAT